MKFGMRVHGGLPATKCVEFARLAEQVGFETLWFAENPFNRGVWPAMTASLLATDRITIGIAAFDELAKGRTALGIGSGIGDRVTRMGLSYAKPLAALRDCTTIVRGMLRGETVTHSGAVFSVENVRLECPVLRPDMPIYLAATGDGALRLRRESRPRAAGGRRTIRPLRAAGGPRRGPPDRPRHDRRHALGLLAHGHGLAADPRGDGPRKRDCDGGVCRRDGGARRRARTGDPG
jgi:alkanesulfonate monooxygenase SsuD/methylene tetrahydromethanopterin reductase-like flavin-dependent oxidoreductase (luciferase family)